MWHAKLRVSLCEAHAAEESKTLQVLSTRAVDVLAISQAHTVLPVLERAFGCTMSTACFTAQKNYIMQGRIASPKPEYEEDDAPLVAVEDVIQLAINFAKDGTMPACGPVGWNIDGEKSAPVCTLALVLQFPAHSTTHAPRTPVDTAREASPPPCDGDGGNDQGTDIDADPPPEDTRDASPQHQAPRGRCKGGTSKLLNALQDASIKKCKEPSRVVAQPLSQPQAQPIQQMQMHMQPSPEQVLPARDQSPKVVPDDGLPPPRAKRSVPLAQQAPPPAKRQNCTENGKYNEGEPAVKGVGNGQLAAVVVANGVVPETHRRCKLCSELKAHENFCMHSGGWHAWYCEQCKVNYVRKGFRLGLKMDEIRDAYRRGVLEELFDEVAATAPDRPKDATVRSHCAMCDCSLQSANAGATGSTRNRCIACEKLLRKGRSIGLSSREVHSLHQRGSIREVLGLDHDNSPVPDELGAAAVVLNRERTLPEGLPLQSDRDAEGIARMGQLLASGKPGMQTAVQGAAQLSEDEHVSPTTTDHTMRHMPAPKTPRDCKTGCKRCNLCHHELELTLFGVLPTGGYRAYCVTCHPIVSCGSKKGIRVQDLRAAYHDGSLDKLLKEGVPTALNGAPDAHMLQGYDTADSREHPEPESSEWSEGNFE